jgi:outer membrane protein assembly factor BamB
MMRIRSIRFLPAFALVSLAILSSIPSGAETSDSVLERCGIQGGLIVHLGCGDGTFTTTLRAGKAFLVHGLDTDPAHVDKARRHVRTLGLYGPVSIDRFDGRSLPHVDNLANLVVASDLGQVPMDEVMRILRPGGVAFIKGQKTVKPRPAQIDEWTHYLHGPDNNPVSGDTVVGPPRHYQWIGSPRYGRHHDHMSSLSAMVTAEGRLFYIFDEGSPAAIVLPARWQLIARDAFNGVILWKRPVERWNPHLWPLKSGPASLPRRLVAAGDRVYVTLGIDAPLTALDGATGKHLRTYDGTEFTEEVVLSEGVLFVSARRGPSRHARLSTQEVRRQYRGIWWKGEPSRLLALEAASGRLLWQLETPILPGTMAVDTRAVYLHDGGKIVCLDRDQGTPRWGSAPIPRSEVMMSFYLPILVLHDDVVLFSGGETAGKQTGSWYREGKDTLTALSAVDGKVLWSGHHPPSGYRSPEDLFVVDGLVWTGETTSGRAEGLFTARDIRTGEEKARFEPDVKTYWFHHRCHRGKATVKYLMPSRVGVEFIDMRAKRWIPHHWVRGACLFGVMPANGLLYAPQHPCACYLESKLYGLSVLAPDSPTRHIPKTAPSGRLEKGPAYDADLAAKPPAADDWPTYRHDPARSGHVSTSVPSRLETSWQTDIGGRLSSPVFADGKIFVASIDAHAVHAIEAATGKKSWDFVAGARVDSPPTIHAGRVLFGSADGWVYALRSADGALCWRFRAAPLDRRMMSFEQVESLWPVHGSVLLLDGVLYATAGRSVFLDGGLRLLRIDPKTGTLLSETVIDDREASTGRNHQDFVSWLNMPTAMPDVLSSDGKHVYMRSQAFELDGTRLPLNAMAKAADADAGAPQPVQDPASAHLFAPTGFLDDSAWHRTYWMYGSMFVSGWCGYYRAGKTAPSGRILAFDDSTIYGFGRKPKYYRWTTPLEYHLFASERAIPDPVGAPEAQTGVVTKISIPKSVSLNPAATALSIEAWVKADKPDGVILARGGQALGYVLMLRKGSPHFGIRTGGDYHGVDANINVKGRWVHLAGIVTADKKMSIHVDGKRAGTKAPGVWISADPAEAMEIGEDSGSLVGSYAHATPLTGTLDEVRIYKGALTDGEIRRHAANPGDVTASSAKLVLHYPFEKGKAVDASGNGNDGQVEGARPAPGKSGQGLTFVGRPSRPAGHVVDYRWSVGIPVFVRAITLACDTLFVAGPPDLIDEEEVLRTYDDPATRDRLVNQEHALAGDSGGLLWAVSIRDGNRLSEMKLVSPPVFDGMIASGGCLFISTRSGSVIRLQAGTK